MPGRVKSWIALSTTASRGSQKSLDTSSLLPVIQAGELRPTYAGSSSASQRRPSDGQITMGNNSSSLPNPQRKRVDCESHSPPPTVTGGEQIDSDGSTGSSRMYASIAETVAATPKELTREHTFPSEQGGQTLPEFIDAFKRDAADQTATLKIAVDKIGATVAYSKANPPSFLGYDLASLAEHAEILSPFEGSPLCCPVERYVKRMMKYGGCSPCNVVIGLMYLHRIQKRYPIVNLSPTNVQRLLLTAVMVACKVFDDIYYSNKYWGMIGELDVAEMRELELRCAYVHSRVIPHCFKNCFFGFS
jgi:hypothetical protein